jgi:hypothetical protein
MDFYHPFTDYVNSNFLPLFRNVGRKIQNTSCVQYLMQIMMILEF